MGVIRPFKIGEQVSPGLIFCGVNAVMNPFGLQSVEETLHRCIVPAIAFPAHEGGNVRGGQHLAVGFSGILNPSVRMVKKTDCRALPFHNS